MTPDGGKTGVVQTIWELTDEIRKMEAYVLYYQNRILRKKIAIEEIVQGQQCRSDVLTSQVQPADWPRLKSARTIKQIMELALVDFNGSEFKRLDLRDAMLRKYPERGVTIRKQIHHLVRDLVNVGRLTLRPDGSMTVNAKQPEKENEHERTD